MIENKLDSIKTGLARDFLKNVTVFNSRLDTFGTGLYKQNSTSRKLRCVLKTKVLAEHIRIFRSGY